MPDLVFLQSLALLKKNKVRQFESFKQNRYDTFFSETIDSFNNQWDIPLLNVPAVPLAGTTIHLFAGDAMPTVDTLNSNLEKRTLTG